MKITSKTFYGLDNVFEFEIMYTRSIVEYLQVQFEIYTKFETQEKDEFNSITGHWQSSEQVEVFDKVDTKSINITNYDCDEIEFTSKELDQLIKLIESEKDYLNERIV